MKKVTKEVLDFYDEYEGGGLLSEHWVPQKDRDKFESCREQCQWLGEYDDKLHFIRVKELSEDLRAKTLERITELEGGIDEEVICTLKKRVA